MWVGRVAANAGIVLDPAVGRIVTGASYVVHHTLAREVRQRPVVLAEGAVRVVVNLEATRALRSAVVMDRDQYVRVNTVCHIDAGLDLIAPVLVRVCRERRERVVAPAGQVHVVSGGAEKRREASSDIDVDVFLREVAVSGPGVEAAVAGINKDGVRGRVKELGYGPVR